MKNKVTPKPSAISRAAVGRHYGVNGGSVTAWVKAGCPQLPNGLFELAAVDKWLRERDSKKAERASLKDQKTMAEIDRIGRDIKQRDLEIAKQTGAMHDRDECCKSLTEIRARESRTLHTLHERFLTAYPEQVEAAKWIEREVEGIIERLANANNEE